MLVVLEYLSLDLVCCILFFIRPSWISWKLVGSKKTFTSGNSVMSCVLQDMSVACSHCDYPKCLQILPNVFWNLAASVEND